MGYIRHNAIVVTTWNEGLAAEGARVATEIGCTIAGPVDSPINGYSTFVICPDGSKEGWDESDRGDDRRKHFKDWARSKRYEDGSSPLSWVEVAYSSDDEEAVIEDDEWSPTGRRAASPGALGSDESDVRAHLSRVGMTKGKL